MSDIPTGGLFGILAFLILISAFFSGAETAMLSLNRYRLHRRCGQVGCSPGPTG